MPTFTIAPVQEAPVVYEVLSNIDLLFSDSYTAGSLHTLAMLGAVLGLVVGCIRGIVSQKLDVHIVFITILIYMALMVPRVTVEVREGSTGGPFIGAVQLPLGIAASASLFSSISDGLTRLYTDYVTTPSGWTISPNESWKMVDGLRKVVAPKVMDSKINTTVPYFADNIKAYIKRCVVEDLANTTASDAGKRVTDIMEGPDIWEAIQSKWGWRLVTWIDTDGTESLKTCPDYYSALQAIWTTDGSWADFQKEAARLIVGDEDVTAQVRMGTAHREVVEDIISTGESVLTWMKKLYLQNQLVAMAGEGPSGIDTVKLLADAKYDTLIRSTADATLWSEVVWKYATLIWVLVIALLPFLAFLLFLGASGLKLFFTFVAALAWVSLWNPIAAVLQSILAIAYTAAIDQLVAGGSVELGSMKLKMTYYNELAEWISTGNYLMMSVPVIALFMLTGSSIAANSLIGKMNADSQIDTRNTVPREGSVKDGNVAAFNQANGMTGRSETGANSLFNQTLNIGETVSGNSSRAITAAERAAHDHQSTFEKRWGQMAEAANNVAKENAYTYAEQRDSGSSSSDQTQAAFQTTSGNMISSGARASAGIAMQMGADQSIKRIIGSVMTQKYANDYLRGGPGKAKSLDGLSDKKLAMLGEASSREINAMNRWEAQQTSEGKTVTDADRNAKVDELRDPDKVTGKGAGADAERERRRLLKKHGNSVVHMMDAPNGSKLANGRLSGGAKGVRSHLWALAGAGYAIMPDVGVSAHAAAQSNDEASNVFSNGNELAESNLMNYSDEERQVASDRWQEVMKSEQGFSKKDTDQVANSRTQAQTATQSFEEQLAARSDIAFSAGSTSELNRQTFMNQSQDLSRSGLRQIDGVGALMETERGQRLLDRKNGGGVAAFAWEAVKSAAEAGDLGMAGDILKQTGIKKEQIRSALGDDALQTMGSTIGDGKLTAAEFNSGKPDLAAPKRLQDQVQGGSDELKEQMELASNGSTVPRAPVEEGATTESANAATEAMPEYIDVMKGAALKPVKDATKERMAENQKLLAEKGAEAYGDNWLEGINEIREKNGLEPIETNSMGMVDRVKQGAARMIDRFVSPDKSVNEADMGAETIQMLEGAQSMIANMDTSKMSKSQLEDFQAFEANVNTAIQEAEITGALGGIELPEDGNNVPKGNLSDVAQRIESISDIGEKYGTEAAAAFEGIRDIAKETGQESATDGAYDLDGNYMNAGETLATHMNAIRVEDAIGADTKAGALVDSAAGAVGLDGEPLRKGLAKAEDGYDAVSEWMNKDPEIGAFDGQTNVFKKLWGGKE